MTLISGIIVETPEDEEGILKLRLLSAMMFPTVKIENGRVKHFGWDGREMLSYTAGGDFHLRVKAAYDAMREMPE